MAVISVLAVSCIQPVSAQCVQTGGTFNFTGNGNSLEVYASGLDWASVDFTNPWGFGSVVHYVDIEDGEIFLRVDGGYDYDPMYYYEWTSKDFIGDGSWAVPITDQGGRNVTVSNSPNVTGFIEYPIISRKAVFLFDTRHSNADLRVIVHNGELIENASVILTNGAREVQWTDENGEAEFTPHTGKYAMIIEHENFTSMLVEDLTFEADKSYRITINMTECISSCGSTFCAPSGDALIMYYCEKEPNMGPISPQQFVNFFSDRLRTCMGSQDKNSDGTLERMMTRYGVAPDPPLNVLLYDCNFTKIECDQDGICTWNIEYIIKNYQQYNCNYTVNLICSDVITELGSGELMPTWSMNGKKTENVIVVIKGDCKQMHLAVLSEKVGD